MSNAQSRRSEAAQQRRPTDELPPHSLEAEAGVLGCIFLAPHECLPKARAAFGAIQPFYDLKHAKIFEVLGHMFDAGLAIDTITFHQRLKDLGNDSERDTGGIAYWAGLPETVPSAANLSDYLKIVREKHVLRTLIQNCQRTVAQCYQWQGQADHFVEQAATDMEALSAQMKRQQTVTPTHIKLVSEFAEEVVDAFFGSGADPEAGGRELPFHFPLRIRPGEMTFMLGEKGMGKSTLWSFINNHLMSQGAKSFVASMEVRKRETIKKSITQLLGRNRLADLPAERALLNRAMAWLNPRCVIFDFLGIVPWRELLDSMKRARQELGCDTFFIDSVMRIGVHADDIAEADECAKHLADFATSNACHLFLVNHLNKSEGDAKKRSRGTYAWVDNSHNVCSVERNQDKGKKIGEILANHKAGVTGYKTVDEKDGKIAELAEQYDGRFVLHNQRMDGTQQNGSCVLWFDFWSGQYRDTYENPAGVNLLERWTKNKATEENQ